MFDELHAHGQHSILYALCINYTVLKLTIAYGALQGVVHVAELNLRYRTGLPLCLVHTTVKKNIMETTVRVPIL